MGERTKGEGLERGILHLAGSGRAVSSGKNEYLARVSVGSAVTANLLGNDTCR